MQHYCTCWKDMPGRRKYDLEVKKLINDNWCYDDIDIDIANSFRYFWSNIYFFWLVEYLFFPHQ